VPEPVPAQRGCQARGMRDPKWAVEADALDDAAEHRVGSDPSGVTEQHGVPTEQSDHAWVANVASAALPQYGSMTPGGRHYPTIAQRKPGSTVALLRRAGDLRAIYLDRRLDPGFREKLMLAVAGANACRQCSFAHREWALAEGVSEEELAALEGMDPEAFDARTWAAIAWVQAFARSDLGAVPDAIDANFQKHFTVQEQADIQLVARTMYWANEISNSLRSGVKRAKRAPVAGSRVSREVEALALYAVGAPVIVGALCVMRRRNPVAMIRDIKPFFHEFERRGPNTISGPGEEYGG
jgi:AhpD family alkylhydroperoxidase